MISDWSLQGDTFNAAWYLARCARDVDVFSDSCQQRFYLAEIDRFRSISGIHDRFIQTSANKTVGLYLISLDQGEGSFAYWGGQAAARMLAAGPVCLG